MGNDGPLIKRQHTGLASDLAADWRGLVSAATSLADASPLIAAIWAYLA
jgi:hypothetical protein